MLNPEKTLKEQIFHSKMLADCSNILNKYKIVNILSGSALLGIIRDSDLIPWSPGVILIVYYNQAKKHQEKVIVDLKKAGFKITRFFKKEKNWKIRADKGRINVEIVGYTAKGKNYYRSSGKRMKTIPLKYLKNLTFLDFRGQRYRCPEDTNGFLTHLYGDWNKIIKSEIRHSYKAITHTRYK